MLFSAIALLICIATVIIGGQQLMRRFDDIEHEQALATAGHVQHALEAELSQLTLDAHHFAESDMAYDFVHQHNNYPRDVFRYETLDTLQVDLVLIVDRDGKELYSAYKDDSKPRLYSPANASLTEKLLHFRSQFTALQVRPEQRLLSVPDGLLAFDAAEITRSDHSMPTGAVLFLGRYIDADELQRIRDTSQTSFDLALGTTPVEAGITDRTMAEWFLKASKQSDRYAQIASDGEMTVAVALHDADNHTIGILQWQTPRSIAALGWNTTVTLLGTIISLLLVASVVASIFFIRLQTTALDRYDVQQRYTNVVHSLDESVVIVDRKTLQIKEANAAVLRRLGCTEKELINCTLEEVFNNLPMEDVRALRHGVVYESQMLARNGRVIDVEVTLSSVSSQNGDLVCLLGRDVTTRKRAERDAADHRRKLSRLANHDPLTGLPNRLFLNAKLPRLLNRLAGTHRMLAIFYVDIDHFKDVNDSRGHPFGDKMLKIFAQRLRTTVGLHDIVARMGGDEFVVVATSLTNLEAVDVVAQRMVLAAQAPMIIDDVTLSVSASIGAAVYPVHAINTETLLKHADIALYQAKHAGRNGYKIFSADMNLELSEKLALEQSLRRALGTDEMFVEYQPIMDLRTGSLKSFEALVRWRHPEMGMIPPARFIPIAEKSGMILTVGENVIRTVVKQLQQWRLLGLPLIPVAVNISPLQLQRIDLANLVVQLMNEFAIESKWLSFEITESAVIHDYSEVVKTLEKLRDLGSKVLIDDFGTGFATLGHLKNLPIDGIKIDRGFVSEVTKKSSDRVIINGIISMARDLKLYTVAEGIETSEQLAKLRELGCDQAQGYYFTSALSTTDAQKMLEQLGGFKDLTDTVKHRVLRRVV